MVLDAAGSARVHPPGFAAACGRPFSSCRPTAARRIASSSTPRHGACSIRSRTAQKEDDVKIARTIYDRYFITSVGDDAANWLAEDYFEQGQFADAARCWKSIFDFHPDTNLPEAKLLVKRAVACFRGGLDDEFRSVRQQLAQ